MAKRTPRWAAHEAEIITAYRDNMRVTEIQRRFGIASTMLYDLLHRRDVPLRSSRRHAPWWQGGALLP